MRPALGQISKIEARMELYATCIQVKLTILLKGNATFYVEKFSCWGRWHKLSLSYVPKDKRRTSRNGDKDLNFR